MVGEAVAGIDGNLGHFLSFPVTAYQYYITECQYDVLELGHVAELEYVPALEEMTSCMSWNAWETENICRMDKHVNSHTVLWKETEGQKIQI